MKKRTEQYRYHICATSGCLLAPVITHSVCIFFSLVGLICHQLIEVNVKAVLFHMTAGTLLFCWARSKHAVDWSLICEPGLSGLWKQLKLQKGSKRCAFFTTHWVFSRRYSIKLSISLKGVLARASRRGRNEISHHRQWSLNCLNDNNEWVWV